MQDVYIVNASDILSDETVRNVIPALREQVYRDFMPAWGSAIEPVRLKFGAMEDIPKLPRGSWPIFLNKHSIDELGWHTQDSSKDIPIHSRVFVGDNMRIGLSWQSTLSHELLEMILDPSAQKVWRMPDGRLAALEACDAVEGDLFSYFIGDVRVSDFVLPAYFSGAQNGPFDFRNVLEHPCPSLSPGGYMTVFDPKKGWHQEYARHNDGLAGRRALAHSVRRKRYMSRTDEADLEIVKL